MNKLTFQILMGSGLAAFGYMGYKMYIRPMYIDYVNEQKKKAIQSDIDKIAEAAIIGGTTLDNTIQDIWNKNRPNPEDKVLFSTVNENGTPCWVPPCNMDLF